ncbi:hypothetical protein NKR23_g8690 [Pleurostoma richardsiae]|uniref:Uncharacterized protein n=1 Tax=Pleurostoma richardsiae TaxID=41990 RepID=A0AA38RPX7_9PEZI|nr:hypothetical protein NKR23_g8690 [Pleurostoma richardsiae]
MLSTMSFMLGAVTLFGEASAGRTSSISQWGDNPSKLPAALVHTPNKIADKPAIILALHPCGVTGQMYSQMTPLNSYADTLRFCRPLPDV